MTEQCYFCKNNTRTIKCLSCQLKAHPGCWKKSLAVSQKCPSCQTIPQPNVYLTRHRISSREEFLELECKIYETLGDIAIKMRELFSLAHNCKLSKNKKKYALKIFRYLYWNMHFFKNHSKFCENVKEKLCEFYHKDGWETSRIIYECLFDIPMPV